MNRHLLNIDQKQAQKILDEKFENGYQEFGYNCIFSDEWNSELLFEILKISITVIGNEEEGNAKLVIALYPLESSHNGEEVLENIAVYGKNLEDYCDEVFDIYENGFDSFPRHFFKKSNPWGTYFSGDDDVDYNSSYLYGIAYILQSL